MLTYSVINSHTDKPKATSLTSQQAAPWHDRSQRCPLPRATASLPVVPTDTIFVTIISARCPTAESHLSSFSDTHRHTQRNLHSPTDLHTRESLALFPLCGVWTLNTGQQAWLKHFFFFKLWSHLASPSSQFLS